MIRFENVTKIYKGDVVALRDVDVDVQKGEFLFLVGPSGSGKSTFLRLLLREELPTAGRIVVAGREIGKLSQSKIPQLRRNIGCIFQDYKLLPTKTIYENVDVRDGGHRPAPACDQVSGAAGARPRGAVVEVEKLPRRAVRW